MVLKILFVGALAMGCTDHTLGSLTVDEPMRVDVRVDDATMHTQSWTVRNHSSEPIRLAKLVSSCTCAQASLSPDAIPPGGVAELEVQVAPRSDDATYVSVVAHFENSNALSFGVTVRALVPRKFQVTPKNVDFGCFVSAKPPPDVKITIASVPRDETLSIEKGPPFLRVIGNVRESDIVYITLRVDQSVPDGFWPFHFLLVATRDGRRASAQRVEARVYRYPSVQVLSRDHRFDSAARALVRVRCATPIVCEWIGLADAALIVAAHERGLHTILVTTPDANSPGVVQIRPMGALDSVTSTSVTIASGEVGER